MNIDQIKEKISSLKEASTSEIDKHINEFFVDDLLDAGIVDYIFSEEEYYLYWMELAKDIKDILDILISEYDLLKSQNREIKDLETVYTHLLESVSIKRIIDEKLREFKCFNELEVKEWIGLEVKNETFNNFILLIGEQEKQHKVIKKLYDTLIKKGYINSSSIDFIKHFESNTSNINKIQWLGTEINIVALFHLMLEHGLIPKSYQYKVAKLIADHFINKKGTDFRQRQLGVLLSRVTSGTEEHLYDDMISIVNELTKIN